MATNARARDLVITRVFDAPRDLVWDAWTKPEHFMKWWGPREFTSPACKMDMRKGGRYLWLMRGPDGKDYWTAGEFKAVEPKSRIVYTDNFSDEKGNAVPASHYGLGGDWPETTLVTITLEDLGDRTRMTLRHEGLPAGEMSDMTGMGWMESFDKMAEALAGEDEIVLTRAFDAPREKVWKAMTDPEQIPKWWGPSGFKTTIKSMDFKVGGTWLYTMHGPDGKDYPNAVRYIEIEKPSRIVSDHGSTLDEPWFRSTISLLEQGGRTHVVLKHKFPNKQQRDHVVHVYGAVKGGREHLAKLAEQLKSM